jgi:hypothetical protein
MNNNSQSSACRSVLRIGSIIAAIACLVLPRAALALCTCLNNASVIDLDAGIGGADGQFAETVIVNGPDGQTWTVTAVSGAYDANNIPPIGTQSALVPVAVGTPMNVLGPGQYNLPFVFIESVGYSLSVSNGRGTTLSIGNNCSYPNPTFSPAIFSAYYANESPVTLGAVSTSGPPLASATFTIDGIPQTQLNPGNYSLAPAVHTVQLTALGTVGQPGNFQACLQGARKTFAVLPPIAIPVLDPRWGVALLAGLLLGFGLAIQRRRR